MALRGPGGPRPPFLSPGDDPGGAPGGMEVDLAGILFLRLHPAEVSVGVSSYPGQQGHLLPLQPLPTPFCPQKGPGWGAAWLDQAPVEKEDGSITNQSWRGHALFTLSRKK